MPRLTELFSPPSSVSIVHPVKRLSPFPARAIISVGTEPRPASASAIGSTLVKDCGPLALKALRERMIEDGLSRGVINSRIGSCFKSRYEVDIW